ncbi:MAG TPA: bacillithiol system redox-active protein YtxJ [Thermoanaerobaculia bacterium]|nr:bacillithiol system redox-active protein YtxJ [Thermoanaerobaculia bacterium]
MAEIEKVSEPEEAERLIERSRERPVVVFKHSLTCGVSAGARRRFESFVAGREGDEVGFVLLEVQNARPLSNAVAEATGVRHQSPQAILLRDGEAVWDTSHGRITEEALGEALEG